MASRRPRAAALPAVLLALLVATVTHPPAAGATEVVLSDDPATGDHRYGTGDSYLQQHMASEHHIKTFDLESFAMLHDLDRNGVLDRDEILAIYGVHHTRSIKHSPDWEKHQAKAKHIMDVVMQRLDKNKDGLITIKEFIAGGVNGLPSFPEYGKNALGHHYDEEAEFAIHHEEEFHSTPETQTDESYVHPEDVEHFAHHAAIEAEEEERERHAQGLPSREEEEKLRKEAEAQGKKYESPYQAMQPKEGSPTAPQRAYDLHAGDGFAEEEARASTRHIFKTPEGEHVVVTDPVQAKAAEAAALEHDVTPERLEGETEEGYQGRLRAHQERIKAAEEWRRTNPTLVQPGTRLSPEEAAKLQQKYEEQLEHTGIDPTTGEVVRKKGESAEAFLARKNKKRFEDTKRRASAGAAAMSAADRSQMKKAAPYKYPPIKNGQSRFKKSSFYGEF